MARANDPMSKQSDINRLALDRKTIETKRVYAGFNICLSPFGLAYRIGLFSRLFAFALPGAHRTCTRRESQADRSAWLTHRSTQFILMSFEVTVLVNGFAVKRITAVILVN